jgi:hypothetical protein
MRQSDCRVIEALSVRNPPGSPAGAADPTGMNGSGPAQPAMGGHD